MDNNVNVERSIHYALSEYEGKTASYEEISPMFLGYQNYPASGKKGPYIRFFYLIHVVEEGNGSFIEGSETYAFAKGDVYIAKPYVPTYYDYGENNGLKYAWIGFSGSFAKKLENARSVYHLNGDYYSRIKSLVDKNDTVYAQPVIEILLDIINEVLSKEENDLLKRVKNYIDENYASDISIETLAKDFSYNRTYLSRVFKKQYGVSLKSYLMNKRLGEALALILDGERVSSACEMVGFSNLYNFSRYFKQRYGVAPSIYLKRRQKENRTYESLDIGEEKGQSHD